MSIKQESYLNMAPKVFLDTKGPDTDRDIYPNLQVHRAPDGVTTQFSEHTAITDGQNQITTWGIHYLPGYSPLSFLRRTIQAPEVDLSMIFTRSKSGLEVKFSEQLANSGIHRIMMSGFYQFGELSSFTIGPSTVDIYTLLAAEAFMHLPDMKIENRFVRCMIGRKSVVATISGGLTSSNQTAIKAPRHLSKVAWDNIHEVLSTEEPWIYLAENAIPSSFHIFKPQE